MSIIKTHDITLYGSTDEHDIILRPLCDDHLPLLYKWNADPDILYWTEGGEDIVRSYDAKIVHAIFGSVSQNAFCFAIEANGKPIGECWLQKMNIPNVKAMYPESTDVRRIDMSIGEKEYWSKGIGTALVRMLVDYAFNGEHVDVLHCFNEDYNPRARRVWEKNGFSLILSEDLPQPQKGKLQHHFRLTRHEYIEHRRTRVSPDKVFELPPAEIQPSQLYVSEGKLRLARDWFDPSDKSKFDPIPIKLYNDKYLMTDGHTRVALATLAGWDTVPVVWDDDPLNMLAYAEDVRWCGEAGIKNAVDLTKRIVPHKDYEILWRKRCHYVEIPPSYAAIVARYGGLDGRNRVCILTDNEMLNTARLIKDESVPFVKSIHLINLDETDDYAEVYLLAPEDLLILHIGIESWMGKHRKHAFAFNKPKGLASKYICIRPTITPHALLEGLNTPEELTESIMHQYSALPDKSLVRVTAKSGTDITLRPCEPFLIPYNTHSPGANAYLPPAEISCCVVPDSANGVIVTDVTVGELRVYADLADSFGLVDLPVELHIENGEIIDISGGEMAHRLKMELWKLPDNCRKIIELGIGLSQMTPSGIIGIDESIAGTCHFGIGNGSGNDAPVHLDVVVAEFLIE
ncbi:MAG: GNAT family N-acetyltransferase [Christensenellales bacterium]|jgi:RimJ/RimL family protein N-acetyltransferase